jgi:ankyrin repeat protein
VLKFFYKKVAQFKPFLMASIMDTNERTLNEILQSCSRDLFPDKRGKAPVSIDSKDVEGDTPLIILVWREDIKGIEIVIKAGADINAIGFMGETPLHIAVRKNNTNISELLLEAGAKTNITSKYGKTSYKMAKDHGGKIEKLFNKYQTT